MGQPAAHALGDEAEREAPERVKVVCRVRPFTARERDVSQRAAVSTGSVAESATAAEGQVGADGGGCITMTDPIDGTAHRFRFDEVFASDAVATRATPSPALIYARHVRPLVRDAVAGFNCTAMCYGQTGSGKTACMFGVAECSGLVPQALADACDAVASLGSGTRGGVATLQVSLIEIYNERITDLLGPAPVSSGSDGSESARTRARDGTAAPMRVRECPERGPYIENLTERMVMETSKGGDMAQSGAGARRAMATLAEGLARRSVHATAANVASSRAHTVLTVRVGYTNATGETRVSTLNLVDLAGSERAGAASAAVSGSEASARLREGSFINKGLSALGNCVRALSGRGSALDVRGAVSGAAGGRPGSFGGPHVPYRDSVLTWLLKRSLDGHAKVVVVATLAPGTPFFAESLSTLRYADRMRRIETAAVVARPKGGAPASTASSAANARSNARRKALSAPEPREVARNRALGVLKQKQLHVVRRSRDNLRLRPRSAGDSNLHEAADAGRARPPAANDTDGGKACASREAFALHRGSPYAAAAPAAGRKGRAGSKAGKPRACAQIEKLDDAAMVRELPDVVSEKQVMAPRRRSQPDGVFGGAPAAAARRSSPSGNNKRGIDGFKGRPRLARSPPGTPLRKRRLSALAAMQQDILSLAKGVAATQATAARRLGVDRPVLAC